MTIAREEIFGPVLWTEAADRLAIRYNDTFVKRDDVWLFAERLLYVDWVDERALS